MQTAKSYTVLISLTLKPRNNCGLSRQNDSQSGGIPSEGNGILELHRGTANENTNNDTHVLQMENHDRPLKWCQIIDFSIVAQTYSAMHMGM